ncbi:hypothetical protein FBY04_11671 [Pseudomonas sp. SJZ080]|nr:hypothetical protein FBY04_11671 [Pseudomonas sp. SJZ080]
MIADDHESAYHPCINGAIAVKARRERSAVKLYFAVALQRADGEGFADEGRLLGHRGMLDKQGRGIFAHIGIPPSTTMCVDKRRQPKTPNAFARATACVRRSTPSLLLMWLAWVLTVCREMNS